MIQADLTGRVALVTGAAGGIGSAIARRLAGCGAVVVASDLDGTDLEAAVAGIVEAGGRAQACPADLTDPAQVESLFAAIDERHGRLDVLVNNAGVVKDGLLATLRDGDWAKVIDVNLTAVMRCTRRALRPMMGARSGRIVNVSSIQALRGGRGQANYAAAKAGVLALTRAVALEVADRGIGVNAVLPGFIETAMTATLRRRAGQQVLDRIPAGRFGTPEDVAGVVLFLCSQDAAFITGQTFTVDGGMSIT